MFADHTVGGIDRDKKTFTISSGTTENYDTLVLATGSYPFVPPIPGKDAEFCHVYRTIEDLQAITASAQESRVGVVIGGGLLGLEAANALNELKLETHVVEFAPRLMVTQLDEAGGQLLRKKKARRRTAIRRQAKSQNTLKTIQNWPL